MAARDVPAAEVAIDADVVRRLLAEQHPDLADRPVEPAASGWDNALFRIGPDLCARLPRRAASVPLVEHEQRWLPALAPRLPLPVPVPLRIGRPGAGYPWPWSICPWVAGRPALEAPLRDPIAAARQLGGFLAALHQPAPADAPANPFRGVPLADRHDRTLEAVDLLDGIDRAAARAAWQELAAAPPWAGPPVWLHGDLHPGNVLVDDGRLVAVVDFGDLTAGDPACDLAVAWMLLPPEARPALRAAHGAVDDATWTRARAWALSLGLAIAAGSADSPAYTALGRRAVAHVLAEPT